jgi:hypothetical protein
MKKSLIAIALMGLCVPMFAAPAGQTTPDSSKKSSKPKKTKKQKKTKSTNSSTPTPSK